MSPAADSEIKKEVDLTGEEDKDPVILDEVTKKAFGSLPVGPTPTFAEGPFFAVDDRVKYETGSSNRGIRGVKGGSVKAVAWMDKYKMHVYKLESVNGELIAGIFHETALTTSNYTVNDVVKFTAFGLTTTRTIKDVSIKNDGTFIYAIAGDFQIRDEDITELVARR